MVLTSLIGTSMMLAGSVGLFTMAVKPEWFEHALDKKSKRKKTDEDTEEKLTLKERENIYTLLFKNMGIIKNKDWIKVNSFENTKCYTLTKFTLSDSLSLSTFVSNLDDIKNKLGVPFLEIYSSLREMCFRCRKENIPLERYEFKRPPRQTLIRTGLDLDDNPVYWDLTQDPHCGIFAESGAGKSRLTHSIICYILQSIPRCKIYMIDLKNGIEYSRYKNVANVVEFAKDVDSAKTLIAKFEEESDRRGLIMEKEGYTDYDEYIKDKPRTKMTRTFLIIDEFADLVDFQKAKSKKEDQEGYDEVNALVRMGRKIRTLGMHMIVSTQRPTTDFIPSSLKSNLGCIIGMKVLNKHNSKLIIDMHGLEELQKSQAIGKFSGKMTFFRSFYIDNKMINDVITPLFREDKKEVATQPTNNKPINHQKQTPPEDYIDVDYIEEDEDDGRL